MIKTLKNISILIIIQVFLLSPNCIVFADSIKTDAYTLSPQLNLPLDSFKALCLNFDQQGLVVDQIDQPYDYSDKFVCEVQRRMKFINKAVLSKFRFDTNAEFFRRYRADKKYQAEIDPLEKINEYKGGMCLDQCIALQKYAYQFFLAGKFTQDIFLDKKIEINVIRELQDDYSYELEVVCEGKSYKITGYIIGAIAADVHLNLSAQESQMLIKGHFAAMTKITLPGNEDKVFVHEPGWAVVEGINYDEKVAAKAGRFYLADTLDADIDEYIKNNAELSWLKDTTEGGYWLRKIKQKGITLFVENNFGKKIRYIYIDEPVKRRSFQDFHTRYMLIKGLADQKIIKIDSAGKMQAMAQIFINNPLYNEVPKSLRKTSDPRDFMPVSMKLYYSGFRTRVLTYKDLEIIYKEIKNKKQQYSKSTDSFLQCGKALGMVLETQMGELAYQSEFFKRFETVFNRRNRDHFIWFINNWSRLRAYEKMVPGKIEGINKKQTLVMEVQKQVEEILGDKFAGNVHHGLQHSLDLLERARELVALLKKETAVDWKVLVAAIYIHDIFAEDSELHGQQAADFVEQNFRGNDIFSDEQIEKVKQAVAFHDKKIPENSSNVKHDLNLETKILYDVDNLDAFGIKGIYRYFAAHISRGLAKQRSAEQVLAHIKQRVAYNVEQRRNNLYFEESKKLADAEFPMTKMFFDKLVEEDYPVGSKKGATGVFSFIWENFQEMPWDIAEKFSDYDVYRGDGEDEIFASLYFRRLKKAYLPARENLTEKRDRSADSDSFYTLKDIDFMRNLIEESI